MQTNHSKNSKTSNLEENLNPSLLSEEEWKELIETEESTFACIRFFQEKELLEFPNEFSMSIERESLELGQALPLPKYLQTYMDMSLKTSESSKETKPSLIVKIAKDGLKFLSGLLDSTFQILPSPETSVRSKEVDFSQTINLEENQSSYQIQYQIIKENDSEVYLSIHFPKNQKLIYEQVILRKNNRFIYSSQIGENGIVSFSGLKEGRYVVEFLGKKSSKSIDIAVLIDHP